jgi:hypothetical protein
MEQMELEAFDESLRGRKTLIVGSFDLALSRFSKIESTSLFKGKSILVIADTASVPHTPNPLLFRKRWDAIFRVKEAFDAQMLVTYISHAIKPVRVFWTGGDIPKGISAKWNGDITLIGFSDTGVTGCEWDVILFPISYPYESMERCLVSRHLHIPTMLQRIKQHLSEIAESKAGIAWSCIDHPGTPGSLYWYDPSEGKQTMQPFTKAEASALLGSIAKWLDI